MASPTLATENKQVLRRFTDELITGDDLDLIDELVTEDVIDHTPLGTTRGRQSMRETIASLRTAFPDHSVTVEDVVAEGDTVAVRVTQRGTHEGEFMGVAATGRSFEIEAMGFVRFEDGRIAERWLRPDVLGMLQQLGAMEPPGR